MNSRVLSHYDLLTVGEAAGVTIEEAQKYANNEGTELGMVFQFEHVDLVREPDWEMDGSETEAGRLPPYYEQMAV